MTDADRIPLLSPPEGKVRAVLDTDTYNEIDDQFMVAHALLAPEKFDVEAIYAAPFWNRKSQSPEDGMVKSLEEIHRLLKVLPSEPSGGALEGSRGFMTKDDEGIPSPAAEDLVRRAKASDEPLYVLASGAITNVASALLLDPSIASRIVVVWLGGHRLDFHHHHEFNLKQDVPAARVVFGSGCPMVWAPAIGAASHLLTSIYELEAFLKGKSALGDYLLEIFLEEANELGFVGKEIWDVAATGWFLTPNAYRTSLRPSPIPTDQGGFWQDPSRHLIRCVDHMHRDPIFRDLFARIAESS